MSVKKFISIGVILVLCLAMLSPVSTNNVVAVASDNAPIVFWVSDPVQPDETVLLYGGNFNSETMVEIGRIKDVVAKSPNSKEINAEKWLQVQPTEILENSIKLIVPKELTMGAYAVRLTNKDLTNSVTVINAPDPWWVQGDLGKTASPGGWIRILGKNLSFQDNAKVILKGDSGNIINGILEEKNQYSLSLKLDEKIAVGSYTVLVHNGFGGDELWTEVGSIQVEAIKEWWKPDLFSVLDHGADPTGVEDSTEAVKKTIAAVRDSGGGVVYFPRGQYKVSERIEVTPYITLRGESRELVSLFWEAQEGRVLPSAIKGADNFTLEGFTVYVWGEHKTVISGYNHVTIKDLRIRANQYYGHIKAGVVSEDYDGPASKDLVSEGYHAIQIQGDHYQVIGNDILYAGNGINVMHGRYGVIAKNIFDSGRNPLALYGAAKLIIEENTFRGASLHAGPNFVSTYFDAMSSYNIYCAQNTIKNVFGGDRESITFDGHGTAYVGKVSEVEGTKIVMAEPTWWGNQNKDMLGRWDAHLNKRETDTEWHGITVYILSGRGAGQYRNLIECNGAEVTIDEPWDIEPDGTSEVSIGKFIGRQLYIGNDFYDGGASVQLYPPNTECIIADNVIRRCNSINAGGELDLNKGEWNGKRVEPSWFNLFLNNQVPEGNSWANSHMSIRVYGANPSTTFPISLGNVIRGNILENNGSISLAGSTADAIIEGNKISNTVNGITISSESRSYVVRKNEFHQVTNEMR